jgi:hypothetical protein
VRRSVRVAFALGSIALFLGPTSAAASTDSPKTVTARVTAAAWYQPDPLCATPLGCGLIPLPAFSPYPKGTYHVGTALGRQTGRAFIGVTLSTLAQAARGGRLSIPLDTNPADGSLAPETANINVCVVYQSVTSVEGGFAGAPSPNCLPAAHAKYVAKPQAHLVANLGRLGGKLSGVKGFALLPADAKPTSAWQVVFKLAPVHRPHALQPTLTLLVGEKAPTPPVKAHRPDAHHHATSGAGVPVGPVPEVPPAVTTQQPTDPAPLVAPRRAGRYVTTGYQYPQVWLLPLVLIVLVPFTIRAMTRDLTRR